MLIEEGRPGRPRQGESGMRKVATGRLAWSGITRTSSPSDFQRDVGGLADVIIG